MYLNPDQSRQLFRHAVENKYAVLAVNADSHAAITDCFEVAQECDSPVIIETSLWQLQGYSFGAGDACLGVDRYLSDIRCLAESERYADVPVIYHTDHIKGPQTREILTHAISKGASSISLDSSELSPDENIGLILELCAFAESNRLPLSLEMEAGVDDGVTSLEETRELFGEVEKRQPGFLSLWAPGVGTQHGLESDPGAFSIEAVARHRELASELAGRPIGLALHGSSGLSHDQLSSSVEAGVAKVNWSSESLFIRSKAASDYYSQNADKLQKGHADFKSTAMDNGVQEFVSDIYRPVVKSRIEALGSNGRGKSFLESLN